MIGQELEAVFPELVIKRGPEEYRAVDYGRLAVVLLEAVKELKAELRATKGPKPHETSESGSVLILLGVVEDLKREIEMLKSKFHQVEQRKRKRKK